MLIAPVLSAYADSTRSNTSTMNRATDDSGLPQISHSHVVFCATCCVLPSVIHHVIIHIMSTHSAFHLTCYAIQSKTLVQRKTIPSSYSWTKQCLCNLTNTYTVFCNEFGRSFRSGPSFWIRIIASTARQPNVERRPRVDLVIRENAARYFVASVVNPERS